MKSCKVSAIPADKILSNHTPAPVHSKQVELHSQNNEEHQVAPCTRTEAPRNWDLIHSGIYKSKGAFLQVVWLPLTPTFRLQLKGQGENPASHLAGRGRETPGLSAFHPAARAGFGGRQISSAPPFRPGAPGKPSLPQGHPAAARPFGRSARGEPPTKVWRGRRGRGRAGGGRSGGTAPSLGRRGAARPRPPLSRRYLKPATAVWFLLHALPCCSSTPCTISFSSGSR